MPVDYKDSMTRVLFKNWLTIADISHKLTPISLPEYQLSLSRYKWNGIAIINVLMLVIYVKSITTDWRYELMKKALKYTHDLNLGRNEMSDQSLHALKETIQCSHMYFSICDSYFVVMDGLHIELTALIGTNIDIINGHCGRFTAAVYRPLGYERVQWHTRGDDIYQHSTTSIICSVHLANDSWILKYVMKSKINRWAWSFAQYKKKLFNTLWEVCRNYESKT